MSLIVVFTNDGTGDGRTGNYRVGVFINDTSLYHGEVKNHDRRAGWKQLLQDFLDSLKKPKASRKRK